MDFNALQVRLSECTYSVQLVAQSARGRATVDEPMEVLMVNSLTLFAGLANDFFIEVAAAARVDGFIQLVANAVSQPGSNQNSFEEIYKRFKAITREYLVQVRKVIAAQRRAEIAARKAARNAKKRAAKSKRRP